MEGLDIPLLLRTRPTPLPRLISLQGPSPRPRRAIQHNPRLPPLIILRAAYINHSKGHVRGSHGFPNLGLEGNENAVLCEAKFWGGGGGEGGGGGWMDEGLDEDHAGGKFDVVVPLSTQGSETSGGLGKRNAQQDVFERSVPSLPTT
jgi:hypothetical protein